jgi:hypothetical protein
MKWCADCRTRFLGWFPPKKKLSAHDTVAEDELKRRAWRRRGLIRTRGTHRESQGGNTETDTGWGNDAAGAHSLDSPSTVESSGRVETTSSLHQTLELFWLRRLCCLCSQNAITQTGDLPSPQGGLAHCLSTVVQTLHMQPHRGCSTHNSNITWIASQS